MMITHWLTLTYDGKSSISSTFSNYNSRFSPFKHKCAKLSSLRGHFYLYSDSFNIFKPKMEKVSVLRAQFSLHSDSFSMFPTYFWATSIFLVRFGPRLLGKKFAEDLRGVGKSWDILNFIYQCIVKLLSVVGSRAEWKSKKSDF